MSARTLRAGFSPITFNNEDLTRFRDPIPFEVVLDHVAELGFAGTERGSYFPEDPEVARAACDKRGLTLVGAWCGLELASAEDADLAHARAIAGYVARAGGAYVNLAHAGTPARRMAAGVADAPDAPRLDAAGWQRVADRVNRAGEICQTLGVEATFHPHAGTWIETRAEIDQLMRLTDPALVSLCFDVGHALVGGMDPLATLRDHAERVRYVHVKDVDATVLAELKRERYGFEESVRRFVFTELSRGLLDLKGLRKTLDAIGYSGWLMVEQDTSSLAPEKAAAISSAALQQSGLMSLGNGGAS